MLVLPRTLRQRGETRSFAKPEPRARVLKGIACHDDGWAVRDAHPSITRQGKPSAFSIELVGKYSAFKEIDIEDYLAVRDRAEEHTSELQSPCNLVCRLLLEKKKKNH